MTQGLRPDVLQGFSPVVVADTRLVNKYNFFVLEVVRASIDPSCRNPQTLHHRGNGKFMLAGEAVKLPSKMK